MKKKLLCLGLAAGIGIAGSLSAAEKAPAISGTDLLEKRCSVCHPSSRPKGAKKSPDQWEATVSRMMGKGAKLSGDEKKVLVEYLSKTYKP